MGGQVDFARDDNKSKDLWYQKIYSYANTQSPHGKVRACMKHVNSLVHWETDNVGKVDIAAEEAVYDVAALARNS